MAYSRARGIPFAHNNIDRQINWASVSRSLTESLVPTPEEETCRGWHALMMTLQWLPSALPSSAWIPSGWHMHASADGDLWNYIILKGVPSMRKSITIPCTLKQALHGEYVTSVTWKLSFQPCFSSFWRNPPTCFICLLLLKGENMVHLTSWFLHGCAISL